MTATAAVRAEFVVASERMEPGEWSRDLSKRVGEGDVQASYSGDVVPEGRVRRPFKLGTTFWVAVRMVDRRALAVAAYRLVPSGEFVGESKPYAERTAAEHDAARADPRGFYHGLAVKRGSREFALAGPPATIRGSDDPPACQRELF